MQTATSAPTKTREMEALVVEEGRISQDQAVAVVGLAKASNLMFGGTADFIVAQEFAEQAPTTRSWRWRDACSAVAAIDETISMPEEAEIHRITNQLKILPQDLTKLRVRHGRYLPGLAKKHD